MSIVTTVDGITTLIRFDISSSTVGLIDGSFEIGKFYMHFYYLVIRIAEVKTVRICSPPLILNQR